MIDKIIKDIVATHERQCETIARQGAALESVKDEIDDQQKQIDELTAQVARLLEAVPSAGVKQC